MEGESGEQVKDELESVTSLGESFMQECLLIRLLSSVLLFHAPLYFSFTCFDSVQDPLRTAGVIFLQTGCLSCRPNTSVKASNGIRKVQPNEI